MHNPTVREQLLALGFKPTWVELDPDPHWLYYNGRPYMNGKGRSMNKKGKKARKQKTEMSKLFAPLAKQMVSSRTTSMVASVVM